MKKDYLYLTPLLFSLYLWSQTATINESGVWFESAYDKWLPVSGTISYNIYYSGEGIDASFHHNLIASNNSRNPRFSGSSTTENSENEFVDFRNNVIYNWGANSIYGGEKGTYNIVNNYFKSGPATTSSKRNRIVSPSEPYGQFYVNGNVVYGYEKITENNWDGGVQCSNPEAAKLSEEISIQGNIEKHTALEAYDQVLKNVGANIKRDTVDSRIILSVEQGNANFKDGIIDSQENVGGWPLLNSVKAKMDSDEDGMPDWWETENELDIKINDASLNTLNENYTNIEVYCNSLTTSCSKHSKSE